MTEEEIKEWETLKGRREEQIVFLLFCILKKEKAKKSHKERERERRERNQWVKIGSPKTTFTTLFQH